MHSEKSNRGRIGVDHSNILRKSTGEIETAIAHYPSEEIRDDVLWLAEYCRRCCRGSFPALAKEGKELGFRHSPNYYYQVLTGRYFKTGGSPEALAEIITAFRKHDRIASRRGRIPFVETPTWRDVRDYIDRKRDPENVCKFGVIAAQTGTQKTACLKEYATRNNHGAVVRFEAPAKAILSRLLAKWSQCYGIEVAYGRNAYYEHRLRENLNSRKTAIIENAQRLYIPSKKANQELFSFLQEIQEDTGCTIILSWTRGFTTTFLGGEEREFFEQFVGRLGGSDDILELQDYATREDLSAIAKSVGLKSDDAKAAIPILRDWSRQPGRIRILFDRLQRAIRAAEADHRKLTIQDLEEVV